MDALSSLFEKVAVTASVYKLQQYLQNNGGLEALQHPEAQSLVQQIQAEMNSPARPPSNERFIRSLGHGMEHQADLVVHPQHGIVVRKSPLGGVPIQQYTDREQQFIDAWQRAHAATGHSQDIGRVHGITPSGISFHEYVHGQSGSPLEAMNEAAAGVQRIGQRAQEAEGIMNKYRVFQNKVNIMAENLSPDQRAFIRQMSQEFPDIGDFFAHNRIRRPGSAYDTLIDSLDSPLGVLKPRIGADGMPIAGARAGRNAVGTIANLVGQAYDEKMRPEEVGILNKNAPFQIRKGQMEMPGGALSHVVDSAKELAKQKMMSAAEAIKGHANQGIEALKGGMGKARGALSRLLRR